MSARLAAVLALAAMSADARILVHGHRGARALRPENTIPAFEYAIGVGVDALEMDIAVTRDNVLVVSHDPILHPPVCSGPAKSAVIHELTLAQVRQWDCGAIRNPNFPRQTPIPGTRMPTLDEVLDLAGKGTFDFNIETKSFPDKPQFTPPPEEFARLLLDRIRAHHLESRVIVQSFDFRTLIAMKKLAPQIRLSALYEKGPLDFVAVSRQAGGAQIVSPNYKLVSAKKVKAAHDAGLQVVPWTADAPKEWDKLIKAGVDAIITDDPAALLAYLKAKGLH